MSAVGYVPYTPAQLAFMQQQVAAAEGNAMFPGNAMFGLTATGQLTSAQITAQQRTQEVQRQVDALTQNVNDLQRRWQTMEVPSPVKILLGETNYKNLSPIGQELQAKTRQLQDLRTQLAQAKQNEALLRGPVESKPIKTTGKARTTPATTTAPPPATSEFPVGDVPAAPGAASPASKYIVPAAIAVGAVALLAGGYYLTRPR